VSTSPGPTLHVVLTCTKRKRTSALEALQLQSYRTSSLDARLQAWVGALDGAAYSQSAISVKDLYAGDHWQIGRSLPVLANAAGVTAQLWVCSAGYGLIPLDAPVSPYSATFSQGHRDSVWRSGEGLTPPEAVRRWWEGLGRWAGPSREAPRSLNALASRDPGASIWVVASQTYLNAMCADLVDAANTLESRDRLVLISAGTRRLGGLEENFLRFDWRLQGSEGIIRGAAMSLNVRVARLLLEGGWEPSIEGLNQRVQALLREIPPRKPKIGKRMPPERVEDYVRAELSRNPNARATPLLRKLRDELGWACEENRFRRLVEAVRSHNHRQGGSDTVETVR
jgi:hypothetical protein